MPTSLQLLVEQASCAFFAEDENRFEQALAEAKLLMHKDSETVELLEEAIDLFPLGECLECLRAAEARASFFEKHPE